MNESYLEDIFTYHAPHGDQVERYQMIRAEGKRLARLILEQTPASPEQTLAIRGIQSAIHMANAAIAIHEAPTPKGDAHPTLDR